MFKLMSKEIIPDEVQQNILPTDVTGMEAYKTRVEERMHHRETQFVGPDDKSQAENMDVRWKIH